MGRLPRVAVRHWVLVPPARWARVLPRDPEAAQRFRRAVVRRVVEGIERQAHEQLGHDRGRAGALAVLHTVGADLRPRAHVHLIATDGVFVPAARGVAGFVRLQVGFADAQLRELARAVGAAAREVMPEPRGEPPSRADVRVKGKDAAPSRAGRAIEARGAEVFVGEPVEAHDRSGAERLAAYVTRPPLSVGAVKEVGEGSVQVRLREPARDRTVAVRLPKAAFEERVRAMVEQAPSRPVSLHGALAPGSGVKWRGEGVQLRLVESERVVGERKERAPERCGCGGRLVVVGAEPAVEGVS